VNEDTEQTLMRLQRKLLNGGYDDYLNSQQNPVSCVDPVHTGKFRGYGVANPFIRSGDFRESSR